MKKVFTTTLGLLGLLCFVKPAIGQAGPNTLYIYNKDKRTMSSNNTWFIVPIDKAIVQAAVPKPLLPIPTDPTLFPGGFPAGKHPVVVTSGYLNDIRMKLLNLVDLQIPSLMQGSIIVPFVDYLNDGNNAFNYPLNYYIGGTNGNDIAAIVPSLVSGISPFEGTTIFPAIFAPDTAASLPIGSNLYSTEVKPFLLPNPISGPGVVSESFDIIYGRVLGSIYTAHTFHFILNQPQVLNNGRCQRIGIYFNETFANPGFSLGNVTIVSSGLGIPPSPPTSFEGVYDNVPGYTGNGEVVASLPEDCALSPGRVDPAALH